ncbi:MAG: trypsin-like peptidase domain-containing protein [candidate division Zixibacteria bacterium]|nr:trypsin-like peptidase domain-containing protein [candidate division Zixibacteria bacterium]
MRTIVFTCLLLLVFGLEASGQETSLQNQIYRARDMVLPALVHIQPVIKDYQTGELKKQAVVGSGIVFDFAGYVVTNYHVAGRAERIICTLHDKEQVSAVYVGGDPSTDLAVLKLQLDDFDGVLHVAQLGRSDTVQVGQYVLAMGSPLSLARSVSAGVVSTKDRYFSSDYRLPTGEETGKYNLWIQTDAAINPGNSGGPLVDMNGQVIGINSRATFLANNLGFAIPIDIVKSVTQEILANGEVERSWIGVHAQSLQELEGFFGTGTNKGVLIASIDPGSPAEVSFLKAGDIILAIDGVPVSARFAEELPAFYRAIAEHAPGSEMALKVLRKEKEYSFKVTTRRLGTLQGEDFDCEEWGFTVKAITRFMQLENQLSDSLGVLVVGVKRVAPGDVGGLRGGDVIRAVNKEPITTLSDLMSMYTELVGDGTEKILLTVKRGGAIRLVVLNVDQLQAESGSSPHE